MTRFRASFRVFLITLAVGMYAASSLSWLADYLDQVPVDLPKTESGSTLIVIPESERFPYIGGGGGSGGGYGCGGGRNPGKQKRLANK